MTVIEYGDPAAEAVLIQPADERELSGIDSEIAAIRRLTDRPFRLLAVKIEDWDRELSPWPAPAVFGREAFGGGAGATLHSILSACADTPGQRVIGGYSLAALFSLWAGYETDAFSAVAAASPSVWFPGFTEYMQSHTLRCPRVYLSLGDREEKTRNKVMSTVGDRIRQAREILTAQGAECVLEWNEGNHFRDAEERTARAFAWVLERMEG